jgi:hypothetical protein
MVVLWELPSLKKILCLLYDHWEVKISRIFREANRCANMESEDHCKTRFFENPPYRVARIDDEDCRGCFSSPIRFCVMFFFFLGLCLAGVLKKKRKKNLNVIFNDREKFKLSLTLSAMRTKCIANFTITCSNMSF